MPLIRFNRLGIRQNLSVRPLNSNEMELEIFLIRNNAVKLASSITEEPEGGAIPPDGLNIE